MVLENVLISFFFFFLACGCPVSPALLIEESVFSPLHILASLVVDKLTTAGWGYFWASYLAALICISGVCVCVCVCVYVRTCTHWCYTVLTTSALKSGSLIPPASLFFLKSAFTIQGLLCFIHIKNFFVLPLWQKCHWEFDRDCIDSINCLG